MKENKSIQTEFENSQTSIKLWFDTNVSNSSSGSPYLPMKELLNNEILFIADMQRLKNGLSIMLDKVSKKEKIIIEDYINKIDTLLELYNKLDFVSAVKPAQNDIHKVASILQSKYQNPAFAACMDQLASLVVAGKKIDSIYGKYEDRLLKNTDFTDALANKVNDRMQQRLLTAYTSMPFQKIMRFQMPLEETMKSMKKNDDTSSMYFIESSIEITKGHAKRVQDLAMDSLEKPNVKAEKMMDWYQENLRSLRNKLKSALSEPKDPKIMCKTITEHLKEFSMQVTAKLDLITKTTEPWLRNSVVAILNKTQNGIEQLSKASELKSTNNTALMRMISVIISNLISMISKQSHVIAQKEKIDDISQKSLTGEREIISRFKNIIKQDSMPDSDEKNEPMSKF